MEVDENPLSKLSYQEIKGLLGTVIDETELDGLTIEEEDENF